MFFYMSFLRPPQLQSSPSSPLIIIPQIANDLRTELFAHSQDIYYAWYLSSHKPNTLPEITKPQKLTTWRQASAYKELSIPSPPDIREGQSCSLVLTAHGQGYPHILELGSVAAGERPFPVVSMPILFSSKNPKGRSFAEKQEYVERVYRVPVNTNEQVFLRIQEHTSFDLDKKVWDSGIGLSSWIVDLASRVPSKESAELVVCAKDTLLAPEMRRVIELGAGTGIVSLTLGALRSNLTTESEGCILATDLPSAMPLLKQNIHKNASLFRSQAYCPNGLVLNWDEEVLPPEISAVREGFDLIIMADVTYNTSAFPSLVRTVARLLRLRPSQGRECHGTVILLGYKERDPAERTLWAMMRDIGVALVKIDERCGAGGDPVEIWIGIAQ